MRVDKRRPIKDERGKMRKGRGWFLVTTCENPVISLYVWIFVWLTVSINTDSLL